MMQELVTLLPVNVCSDARMATTETCASLSAGSVPVVTVSRLMAPVVMRVWTDILELVVPIPAQKRVPLEVERLIGNVLKTYNTAAKDVKQVLTATNVKSLVVTTVRTMSVTRKTENVIAVRAVHMEINAWTDVTVV